MGCGSLCFSLPHFLTGRYDYNEDTASSHDYCTSFPKTGAADACAALAEDALLVTRDLSKYRYFFLAGQFLHGIGAAPLITLGTTLLDESVSKRNSPMYIGIFQVTYAQSGIVAISDGISEPKILFDKVLIDQYGIY